MNKCVNYFWLVFESILENISYKYMGLKKLALDFKSLLSNLNCIDNEGTFKSIILSEKDRNLIFVFLLIRLFKSWCVWLSGYWIADSTSFFSPPIKNQSSHTGGHTMTIAYYKGKRYKAEPKPKTKPKTKPISDDVINQDEVEYNQLQNKIMDDKINNAYFSTVEKLNKVTGLIVEGAMRKHKQEEEL